MLKEKCIDDIGNIFHMIGRDWMLVTAASGGRVNTMTASWGCAGILWNRPVCVCFIRPQRYTYELIEGSDVLSMSFFGGERRRELAICGAESGRNCDKFALTGLTPAYSGDTPYISEAGVVLICRKLYADDLKGECMLVPELQSHYMLRDYHRMYVCGIEKVLADEK